MDARFWVDCYFLHDVLQGAGEEVEGNFTVDGQRGPGQAEARGW